MAIFMNSRAPGPSQGPSPEEDQGLLRFMQRHHALKAALERDVVLEIGASASEEGASSLVPRAAGIGIDPADTDATLRGLREIKPGQECILARNILPYIGEYREFIAVLFDKLAMGGFLIVIVPHQFLYERKLQVPSRRNSRHVRFYTPNTLLAEVEEALDPCAYRVRLLVEDDTGYDYQADLESVPAGGQHIVLCLEKIRISMWRDQLEAQESRAVVPARPTRFLPLANAEPGRYRVVAPDHARIERLLILKLDHRGDFVLADPAFRILRSQFPDASISLVCGGWNRAEAERLELFDEIIPFDFFSEDDSAGNKGPTRDQVRAQFGKEMNGRRYDLAIDLRLYDDTRELLRSIEARHKAGFDRHDQFPWLSVQFNLPSPTMDGRAAQGLFPAADFSADPSLCEHTGGEIQFNRSGAQRPGKHILWGTYRQISEPNRAYQPGKHIIWGPYRYIAPGEYEFEILIEALGSETELNYDLSAAAGRRSLGAGRVRLRQGHYPRIAFATDEEAKDLEFRLAGVEPVLQPFRFMGLRHFRKGAYSGIHQQEAMALLAHLVALRMRNPYRVNLS